MLVMLCLENVRWHGIALVCGNFLSVFKMLEICTKRKLYFQLEEIKNAHGDALGKINIGGELPKKEVPEDPIEIERRQKVKEAMLHAWSSYEQYAWGQDELQVL